MSILIKGMEMPKHDDEYVIFTVFGDGRVVYDPLNRPYVRYKNRAVPVSPHGRLIDADEFLNRAIGTKCFRGDYALMLEELVGESTTILEAEGGRVMLSGDCNVCMNGKLPSYSATCIECGLSRKNYKPIIPADDSKLSETVKCGGAVTCAVAYSEEVYGKHIDTAGNLRWTGTHSGEHKIKAEEGEL